MESASFRDVFVYLRLLDGWFREIFQPLTPSPIPGGLRRGSGRRFVFAAQIDRKVLKVRAQEGGGDFPSYPGCRRPFETARRYLLLGF